VQLTTFAWRDRRTIAVIDNNKSPGLALSVVSVGESHLISPHSPKGDDKYTKYLTGMLLSQEELLFMSTVLMTFNLESATGPVKDGFFTFSCRPLYGGRSLQN